MKDEKKKNQISRSDQDEGGSEKSPSLSGLDEEDVRQILAELGIDPTEQPEKLVSVLLTQIVSQSTVGPYPPPIMLKEYKEIDPRIVDEILGGARAQREHRMALENSVTLGAQTRQDRAQRDQTITALASIIVAALLAGVPPYFGLSVPSVIPIALIAIGVGGRPVATVITKWIARAKKDD